jgi:hypothetical protein
MLGAAWIQKPSAISSLVVQQRMEKESKENYFFFW